MRKRLGPTIYQRKDTGTYYVLYRINGKQKKKRIGENKAEAELALLEATLALAKGLIPFEEKRNQNAPEKISRPIDKPISDRSRGINTLLSPINSKPDPEPAMTLGKFRDKYLSWSKRVHSRKTYEDDHSVRLKRFVRIFGENRTLASIGVEEIEEYKAQRLQVAARSTVWGDLKTVKAFFEKAVIWKHLEENPAKTVRKPKVPQKQPEFLSEEQVELLLEASKGSKVYGVLAAGIFAGLRKQEIEWLGWGDIDFKEQVIRIRPKEGWTTKNYKSRTIPLHSRFAEILKELPRISRWVISNNDGGRYTNNMLRDLKRVAKAAGVKSINIHMLRHTFASLLVKRGVSIFKVKEWLGHAAVTTTQIYSHLQGKDDDIEKL